MGAAAGGHQCTVLIVDDDRDVQEMLRVALTASGYRVSSADSGRDALDYLRSHEETCVILLDLLLPGMSGAEFRHAQRRDRSHAWIPVILLSGAVGIEHDAAVLGAPVVAKPVDLDQLREALVLATKNCRNRDQPLDELAGVKRRPLSSA